MADNGFSGSVIDDDDDDNDDGGGGGGGHNDDDDDDNGGNGAGENKSPIFKNNWGYTTTREPATFPLETASLSRVAPISGRHI